MVVDQGSVVEGYRVEELLGRGGMGAVFRARHLESERVVALKLVAGEDGRDAAREGKAQAALEHPNVVTVYDAGTYAGGAYLAMRLVDGPPLSTLIEERRLDARRALDLLEQVAGALDAAHDAGLVHRDVKPHNVLIGPRDHAELADFGLTRSVGATMLSGAIAGTVAYLAPEVVRGDDATPAADRYAFAAMAFECLTGTVPFPRPTDAAVLFAHANEPPPRASDRRPELGPALDDAFARALSKDPAERPASARQLVSTLRRSLERADLLDLPAPAPVGAAALAPSPPPPAPPGHADRRPIVLAVLAGVALAAALWLVLRGDDDATTAATPALFTDKPGLVYVGADLSGAPARPLDCRGRAPSATSPACTIVQSALPGATVVVPRDGALREWAVRGARGEVTLAVTRPRDGGSFQIGLSATEAVGSADVQTFPADIEVERGDRIGLLVTDGSAVGARDARGATTDRWLPPLTGFGRPADRGAGTGFDHELLLRAGIKPGAKRHQPEQLTGSQAAALPDGRERARQTLRIQGRTVALTLVRRGDRFAVDQTIDGRRVASIDVPGLRPAAQLVRFVAAKWGPDSGGVDVHFVNPGSGRLVKRGYEFSGGDFTNLG